MGELNEDDVEANAALPKAVARELLPAGGGGGATPLPPFQLASRHRVMKLGPDESTVHIVQVKGKPLMVLTTLLESFRVSRPRRCIQRNLLPFFRACGVSGCDVSNDDIENDNEPNLASGGQDRTPLAKCLESDVEDYERALAARSGGLVRGRSAWNDGRETRLIDFPLLVLVINRLRTPQARRFQLASLEHLRPRRQPCAIRCRQCASHWNPIHPLLLISYSSRRRSRCLVIRHKRIQKLLLGLAPTGLALGLHCGGGRLGAACRFRLKERRQRIQGAL